VAIRHQMVNKLGQAIHTSAKEIQQKEERPKK
jgi:hypothetical protein